MKKLFVCALVALSGVLSVNAQGGFGNFDPEEMAKMSVQHMDEQLDLNEEQEGKIKTIYLDMFKGVHHPVRPVLYPLCRSRRGAAGGSGACL